MSQEGSEARDDVLARRHVVRESHPASWPLVEVGAEGQLIERGRRLRQWLGARYGTTFRLPRAASHGPDDHSKPVSSRARIRLRGGTILNRQAEHRSARAAAARRGSDLLGLPAAQSGLRSSGRPAVRVHSRVGLPGRVSVPHAPRELPALRGAGGSRPLGQREASPDEGVHAVSGALGTQTVLDGGRGVISDVLGEGLRFGGVRRAVGAGASNAGTDLRHWRG